MRGDLQSEIKPYTTPIAKEFNTGASSAPRDASGVETSSPKVDFLSVLQNSNSEVKRERDAKKTGDLLSGAESYDEFLKKMEDNTKKLREPKNNLDKDDFLKLFVTQLQNQDPLNPDDSTEMASQLAQFNSLEQGMNANKTLGQMLDMQKQNRSAEMVNYIGKEVEIDGGRLSFNKEGINEATFKVSRPATAARLEIRDTAGQVIHTRDLGTLNAGEQKLGWDGVRNDGSKANDGIYRFSIVAEGINKEDIPVTLSSHAKITGVDLKDKEGLLHTNLGKIKFDEVNAIGEKFFSKLSAPTDIKAAAPASTTPPSLDQNPGVMTEVGKENLEAMKPMIQPELMQPQSSSLEKLALSKAADANVKPPSESDTKTVENFVPRKDY